MGSDVGAILWGAVVEDLPYPGILSQCQAHPLHRCRCAPKACGQEDDSNNFTSWPAVTQAQRISRPASD
jgi:hypothetical protein